MVTVIKGYSVYMKYCSEQGEKNHGGWCVVSLVIVRILIMSKFGFKDKVWLPQIDSSSSDS
jgi:hypothetical protein